MASTASPAGTPGSHNRLVCETMKDVECVPEQAEAKEPAAHEVARAPHHGLCHHENEPYETRGHVRAVQSDEAEKGREEGAARGAGALRDHAREFAQFQAEKRGAE